MPHHTRLVVINPASGRSDPELLQSLASKRKDTRCLVIDRWDALPELLEKALEQTPELERVVVCGGDGTVASVRALLGERALGVGIVPVGTGNVLAKYLELPLEPQEAMQLALESPQTRALDAMRVGEHWLNMQLSVGISAEASAETSSTQKQRFGRLSYLYHGLRAWLRRGQTRFVCAIDGQRHAARGMELLVVSLPRLGVEMFDFGPDSRPDDGAVEVYVISRRHFHFTRWADWSGLLLRRKPLGRLLTQLGSGQQIELQAPADALLQGDGDALGRLPLTVQVEAAATRFVVAD